MLDKMLKDLERMGWKFTGFTSIIAFWIDPETDDAWIIDERDAFSIWGQEYA